MDDLVRWLGAQLDEDERIVRATLWGDDGALNWRAYDRGGPSQHWGRIRWVVIDGADEGVVDSQPQAADDGAVARHIAEWDPARVLREIDAKRQIIRLHEITIEKTDAAPFDSYTGERLPDEYSVTCSLCGWATDDPTSACLTLRLLALPYSDRPGYQESWRP